MRKVRVCIELEEESYRAYEAEARKRGVTVESLVEQTANGLIRELEEEERDGTDHPVFLP